MTAVDELSPVAHQGTSHLDWRVGHPTGAPVDEVRRVRDDIDPQESEAEPLEPAE